RNDVSDGEDPTARVRASALVGSAKSLTPSPSKNGASDGSVPVFSYSLVSDFVAILLASTSGWLKGLIPITAPAIAVAISQRTNSSARSYFVATRIVMTGFPAFSNASTAASCAASGASSSRREGQSGLFSATH